MLILSFPQCRLHLIFGESETCQWSPSTSPEHGIHILKCLTCISISLSSKYFKFSIAQLSSFFLPWIACTSVLENGITSRSVKELKFWELFLALHFPLNFYLRLCCLSCQLYFLQMSWIWLSMPIVIYPYHFFPEWPSSRGSSLCINHAQHCASYIVGYIWWTGKEAPLS